MPLGSFKKECLFFAGDDTIRHDLQAFNRSALLRITASIVLYEEYTAQ